MSNEQAIIQAIFYKVVPSKLAALCAEMVLEGHDEHEFEALKVNCRKFAKRMKKMMEDENKLLTKIIKLVDKEDVPEYCYYDRINVNKFLEDAEEGFELGLLEGRSDLAEEILKLVGNRKDSADCA